MEHYGGRYDIFWVPIAQNVLAQIYNAGATPHVSTIHRIILHDGPFTKWMVSTMFLRLAKQIEMLSKKTLKKRQFIFKLKPL